MKIDAGAWNRVIAGTEWTERQRRTDDGFLLADRLPAGMVYVQNFSGADRDRFSVLAIDSVLVEPTTTERESIFNEEFAFVGIQPAENQSGKFVVLAEAIDAGKIGPAYIDGVFPALVSFDADPDDSETNFHLYADLANGENYLRSMGGGAAQILYRAKVDDPDRVLLRIAPGFQTGLGNADADIAKGSAGPITVKTKLESGWPLSAGSETASGVTISAFARMADIDADDEVIWAWTDGAWEVWQVECTG